MGLIKAAVRVDPSLDAAFAEALQLVTGEVDEVLHDAANRVQAKAQATAAFVDKTGLLRRKIKAEKSKFPDGGWIVTARAPHAHLVEQGHLLVKKNKAGLVKVVGHVPAHPFLRPALDSVVAQVVAELTAGGANG